MVVGGIAVSGAELLEVVEDVGSDDGDEVVDLAGAGEGWGAAEEQHSLSGAEEGDQLLGALAGAVL